MNDPTPVGRSGSSFERSLLSARATRGRLPISAPIHHGIAFTGVAADEGGGGVTAVRVGRAVAAGPAGVGRVKALNVVTGLRVSSALHPAERGGEAAQPSAPPPPHRLQPSAGRASARAFGCTR